MNNKLITSHPTLMPQSQEWQERAIALRNALSHQDDMPKYLLACEVITFLNYAEDDRALMLFQLLWNTGARVNEALRLTPSDFTFGVESSFVRLINLKRRRRNLKTNEDLVVKESYRTVPLTDKRFIQRIQQYIKGHSIKQTQPILNIQYRTADNWCKKIVNNANSHGVTFTIPISCHTFRHSYAMHMVYNGVKQVVLQRLLGHSSNNSTMIYTNVLAIEAVQREIRFLV